MGFNFFLLLVVDFDFDLIETETLKIVENESEMHSKAK